MSTAVVVRTAAEYAASRSYPVIAKCFKGHTIRDTFDPRKGWQHWLVCECGALGVAKKLDVKFSERVCNSVCMGAQGPSCSCSCDGENHGSAHVYRVSS